MAGLSLTLLIWLSLFLMGLEKRDHLPSSSQAACYTMAVLIHYFLLASFGWTMALASLLYFSLVDVLADFDSSKLKKIVLAVFGKGR